MVSLFAAGGTAPERQGLIMRYNEPPTEEKFLNQHALEYHGVPEQQQEQFHHTLQQHLYDPRHYYAHQWQQGDVVVADNFSLLHGREVLPPVPRVICSACIFRTTRCAPIWR